jgi:hypothetical protein
LRCPFFIKGGDNVKFKCEIDGTRTLKKKDMKVTLFIESEEAKELNKNLYNFLDKPLIIEMRVDDEKQAKRLKQITKEQRDKIHAILRDMENYIGGETVASLKETTKESFIRATEGEDFSLSDCSKEIASAYIEYLIELCMELGVPLNERPDSAYSNTDKYLEMCLRKKICCICGKPGEVHHVDTIGMGRDRTKIDDSRHRKMCLCREHHSEVGNIGQDTFDEKYHVYGILWEG